VLKPEHEISDGDAESPREADQRHEARIAASALDASDLRRVQSCYEPQALLRKSGAVSGRAKVRTELCSHLPFVDRATLLPTGKRPVWLTKAASEAESQLQPPNSAERPDA
jgi:hypothetical protein